MNVFLKPWKARERQLTLFPPTLLLFARPGMKPTSAPEPLLPLIRTRKSHFDFIQSDNATGRVP